MDETRILAPVVLMGRCCSQPCSHAELRRAVGRRLRIRIREANTAWPAVAATLRRLTASAPSAANDLSASSRITACAVWASPAERIFRSLNTCPIIV